MKTSLIPGEVLIKKGGANLSTSIGSVGGFLYLTTKRLVFEPHIFNLQSEIFQIYLKDIASISKSWTKLLGLIPIFPNAATVSTKDGKEYSFTLWEREKLISEIEKNRSELLG